MKPTIGTWLTPRQRSLADTASDQFFAVHRDSLVRLQRDLLDGVISAVLVSAELTEAVHIRVLRDMRAGFPLTQIVGIASDASLQGALRLGRAGVSQLIDARNGEGPARLRSALANVSPEDSFPIEALEYLLTDVDHTPPFASLLRMMFDARYTNVRQICQAIPILPSTLMSRFFRAQLPAPKKLLAWCRLAYATRLAEQAPLSNARISARLNWSSPQSFSRACRSLTGLPFGEFVTEWKSEAVLAHMRKTLIEPHRNDLPSFDPTANLTGYVRLRRPHPTTVSTVQM